MRLCQVIVLLGIFGYSFTAGADDCQTLRYTSAQQSVEQLREIAALCNEPEVKNLYYHRAQHQELVSTNQSLQSLGQLGTGDQSASSLKSYRMYMAMLEMMAERTMEDNLERAALLNQEYARFNDLFELRIKGFDRLADRMERSIYSN